MEPYRSDEEQVEALRRWWQNNGRALLLGVGLAVAVVIGWDAWKQQQGKLAESLSTDYQHLLDTAGEPGRRLDEVRYTTAQHLAEQIKARGKRTVYAGHAALLMARVALEQGDGERARQELEWAYAQAFDDDMRRLAGLRLAQVLFGAGDTEAALAVLDRQRDAGYLTAAYQQLRGDLLLARDERAAALAAYQAAMDTLAAEGGQFSRVLELKRDALRQADAATAVPMPAAAGSEAP